MRIRWSTHVKALSSGASHCARLQRAWKQYGEGAFQFNAVESVRNEESLREREQAHLDATPEHQRYNTKSLIAPRHRKALRECEGFGLGERVYRPPVRSTPARHGTVVDRYGGGAELYGVLWDDGPRVERGLLRFSLEAGT